MWLVHIDDLYRKRNDVPQWITTGACNFSVSLFHSSQTKGLVWQHIMYAACPVWSNPNPAMSLHWNKNSFSKRVAQIDLSHCPIWRIGWKNNADKERHCLPCGTNQLEANRLSDVTGISDCQPGVSWPLQLSEHTWLLSPIVDCVLKSEDLGWKLSSYFFASGFLPAEEAAVHEQAVELFWGFFLVSFFI